METTENAGAGLGDRILRLRREKGWKQRELASRIGTRTAQVSKFERGTYVPRLELLVRMSEAFDVSLDYLITGREPRQPQKDFRLRGRMEALEALPLHQRDNLVIFLDGLLVAHQQLRQMLEGQAADVPPQPRRSRAKKPKD